MCVKMYVACTLSVYLEGCAESAIVTMIVYGLELAWYRITIGFFLICQLK